VTTTPRINLLDPEFYVDPWEAYGWLRDEAPVYFDPVQKLWGISRYADVMAIEKDGALYSSFSGSRPHIDQRADESMINLDEPDHQRQRKIVANRFSPRGVREHEAHIRGVVTEILDDVVALGECEAIEAIASRLPAMVIGDLLGYPREMWQDVRRWSEKIMYLSGLTDADGPPHTVHPEIPGVIQEFMMKTAELIEQRREDPKDDLLSLWAAGQGWSTKKVLEETLLVLDGGAETTRTVIGSMIRELALNTQQRQVLLDNPELLSGPAVDEFIRWVSPVLNMRRTVTRDHVFEGEELSAGEEILLLYPAANRDPRAFEHPEVLDVARAANRHVAFGFGTHFCLGAHLARLEIKVMFEELLARMPDWQLVDPEEPKILAATFARAYDAIRITFTPS
jgi:cytochrome P450 family 142 subfamily A polypeptide 1